MILNRKLFELNLLNLLKNIFKYDLDKTDPVFVINPVIEKGKKHNSTDDYIKLWLLSDKNTSGRRFSFSEAMDILTCMEPKFPLWIKVSMHGSVIRLDVSLRFRNPSVIIKQNLEYQPFIVSDA